MKSSKHIFRTVFMMIFFCVAIVNSSYGQKKRSKRDKGKSENSIKKEQSNKAEKQAKYKEGRGRHKSIQDKKTRKRMKATRKQSMIHAGHKKLPFYKRWFRRK